MTDKLYAILKAPGQTKRSIRGVQVEISNLKVDMMPSGIRYDKDKVQISPKDSMSEYAARLLKLEEQGLALCNEYAKQCELVDELVAELKNVDQVNVIKAKYIVGLTFEQIADALYFSESYTYKIHRQAIRNLELAIRKEDSKR